MIIDVCIIRPLLWHQSDTSTESDKQVSILLLHSMLSHIREITSMIDVD